MMRRVLMISYYFPPLGGIGSVRAVKFAHYLPEFGWDPAVITPRNGAYYRDPTLEFDERKIVRTPSVEISRTATATGIEDQTFENPKTGAVLETAFVYQDGTKGTDLYLSVTSRGSLPPNPYRR